MRNLQSLISYHNPISVKKKKSEPIRSIRGADLVSINGVFSDKELRRGVLNGREATMLAYNVSVLSPFFLKFEL